MEERFRTRARALALGVEAQMLSLGATAELGRAWRDWTYTEMIENAGSSGPPDWPAPAGPSEEAHGASLSS